MLLNKIAIVAGNGPSLSEIDYSLLPSDFDLFRCNQFYFEERYFLGHKIKYAFFNPSVFFEQYFTAKNLQINNEYTIDGFIISDFGLGGASKIRSDFEAFYPDAQRGYKYIRRLRDFDAFIKFNENYHQKRVTSGVYMCAVAVAMGYRKIYIAGIDLYHEGSNYAFDTRQKNLIKLLPEFKKQDSKFFYHDGDYDLKAIDFLAKHYNVEFYSVCPNSPIVSEIPIAVCNKEMGGGSETITAGVKPLNYTKDIMLPNSNAYKKSGLDWEVSETLKRIEFNSKIARRYSFLYSITGGSLGRRWLKKIKNFLKSK